MMASSSFTPAPTDYGRKPTFASSIKAKNVLNKGNELPPLGKQAFRPANRSEAKDAIFRPLEHNHELIQACKKKSRASRFNDALHTADKRDTIRSQPYATHKPTKCSNSLSRLPLSKISYDNPHLTHKNRPKVSVYDYQKIQSTQHNSQIFGQRQFMMGGPSSGHHDRYIKDLHRERNFKRASPSPSKTFDDVRGASP